MTQDGSSGSRVRNGDRAATRIRDEPQGDSVEQERRQRPCYIVRMTNLIQRARKWSCACVLLAVCPAMAQLTPARLYFGVNRPIPMLVAVPEERPGDARIDLYLPGTAQPVATAPVDEGGVNLASIFPTLWSSPQPVSMYAQLVVGDVKVGPPVVLQPLTNPPLPMLYSPQAHRPWHIDPETKLPSFDPKEGQVVYTPQPAAYSGLRAYIDQHVVFDTSLGEIEFRMRPDQAPNTVANFLDLARGGFYTDIIFHRVVPRLPSGDPFVIQVGDPTGTGDGGPGYAIDLEQTKLAHDFGVLSMARDSDPNTNGSQVFVCLSREGTQKLDGKYTAFAEAVRGADTILAIAAAPVKGDRPIDPPVLWSAMLIDAPPYGTGPARVTRPSQPAKDR